MVGCYRFTQFSIRSTAVLFILFACSFCLTPPRLAAQAFRETTATGDTPEVSKRPQDSLIVGVNLDAVSILVTARNTKGDYISSLKSNDFQVLEDGDEQPPRRAGQQPRRPAHGRVDDPQLGRGGDPVRQQ